MVLVRRIRRPLGRPPTLLVLRVFQRDRAMRALFDTVIERWRLSGNTLLIAGTDLLERTLDAGDIFDFLDGRLAERFILSANQIPARLAGFELEPDAEGRYRVNECYCHDSTWRDTLAALLARSDVVLMDLRSFQRRNEGCKFELGELARAPHLARVVVLTDARTDHAAAEEAAAAAPTGRFLWLDATHVNRAKRREVLNALFVAAPPEYEERGQFSHCNISLTLLSPLLSASGEDWRERNRSGLTGGAILDIKQHKLANGRKGRVTMKLSQKVLRLAMLLTVLVPAVAANGAESPFYKGKTLTVLINYATGGPTDIEGRLAAKHLARFIPGNPTIIVSNMAGAGGVTATNFLGEVAKPDGLTMSYFTGNYFNILLADPILRVNLAKFAYIASIEGSSVAYIRKDVPPGLSTATGCS